MVLLEYTEYDGALVRLRKYVPKVDAQAITRLFCEIKWIDSEDDNEKEWIDALYSAGRALVAEVNNYFECAVATAPGTLRYFGHDLCLSAVSTVATGLGARRRGLSSKLTARLLAMDVLEDGAEIAIVGVFDQGFYNKLGFGAGSYEIRSRVELQGFKNLGKARAAIRFTPDNWQELHIAKIRRSRGQGGINILPASITFSELRVLKNNILLGYRDAEDGTASHFIWASQKEENGPLYIQMLVWRKLAELRELLCLLSSFADQIWVVNVPEIKGIQFATMATRPLKSIEVTKGGEHETGTFCNMEWQFRILDLKSCVKRTSISGGEITFNLELLDPIEKFIPEKSEWRGCAGKWTIHFGKISSATTGYTAGLPIMRASVGAFTRLWAGICSSSALSISDDLVAPEELLKRLDELLIMPFFEPRSVI